MLYINSASEKGVSVNFLIKIKCLLAVLVLAANPVWAEMPKVLASIAPVHSIASSVMAGVGTPDLLIGADQSPHHFSLKPSDAAKLNQADLIIIVHPLLESGLRRALEDKADRLVVLIEDAADPHAWLDPAQGAAMAQKIAAVLSNTDPAHAALYQNNADALQARLAVLTADLQARIAPLQDAKYIVAHNAFASFEQAMGIGHMGTLSVDEHFPASALRVAQLRSRLKANPGACVFTEPQFPSTQLELLVKDTGAQRGVLDPLGASLAPGPALYEAMLKQLAESFIACFED